MRIDRISLPRFRNLVDFELDFEQTSARQVIVGRNGVGKSNLLEAIVRIFRDLDLEEPSAFAYEIEYLCKGRAVRIRCAPSGTARSRGSAGFVRTYETTEELGENYEAPRSYFAISEAEFFRLNRRLGEKINPERLLPNYVFGYYSGDLLRFQDAFAKHEERYYAQQVTGKETPLRPLFLARPHHSQFAFLSFFATDDPLAREFLRREMRIENLDAVLFALREPYWHKGKKLRVSEGADPRFWGAAGKVAPFLSALFANSLAPMAFSERLRVSVGQSETKERRFCYLRSRTALESLASGLSNKEFFARLESLVYSNLVSDDGSDVRIWLRLAGSEAPATFSDLAEGERQLLTVLGLLRFTAEEEALFVLDEPDTHLNPAWCLDYLENLRRYGASLESSQIIMTTHNPVTFAGLERTEVVVMQRRDGQIVAEHPSASPKGMGFAAILTSEIFGLRSTLDRETLEHVERLRLLAAKSERTQQEEQELAQLNASLTPLGFSRDFRDPLFKEFVQEMAKERSTQPDLWNQVLTADQKTRRAELVDAAVRRLRARQEAE